MIDDPIPLRTHAAHNEMLVRRIKGLPMQSGGDASQSAASNRQTQASLPRDDVARPEDADAVRKLAQDVLLYDPDEQQDAVSWANTANKLACYIVSLRSAEVGLPSQADVVTFLEYAARTSSATIEQCQILEAAGQVLAGTYKPEPLPPELAEFAEIEKRHAGDVKLNNQLGIGATGSQAFRDRATLLSLVRRLLVERPAFDRETIARLMFDAQMGMYAGESPPWETQDQEVKNQWYLCAGKFLLLENR